MNALALILALAQTPAGAAPAAEARETAPPPGPAVALDIVQEGAPLGTITFVLWPDRSPLSAANFLEYVRSGHYNGTIFHRVIPDFMIQGGGFTPEMEEKPTRPPIRNEARNRARNARGTVAMARTNDANSATAQFFINIRDNHSLDFGIRGAGYAVFGEVIDGMDVVDVIVATPTTRRGQHENTPMRPVIIQRVYEMEAPKAEPEALETATPAAAPMAEEP